MQGHVDMVTEKNNDVNHDFFNDPLRLQSDGIWLKVYTHTFTRCSELTSAAPVAGSGPWRSPRCLGAFLQDEDRGISLQADGTTLGADNGIGVATALALLDLPPGAEHPMPPLECLFTVDEETGLTGAFDLDPTLLSGMSQAHSHSGKALQSSQSDWPDLHMPLCLVHAS